MASQVVGKSACYEWASYIRGYPEYKTVWPPTVGETLRLTTELTAPQTPSSWLCSRTRSKDSQPKLSSFIGKDGSVGLCEVTGTLVNHAAVFGLEILCLYRFMVYSGSLT